MFKNVLLSLGLLSAALPASANYLCNGKIAYLGVSSDNSLNVSNGFGVHRLCLMNTDYCRAWFAMVSSAKLTDRVLSIYYQNPNKHDPAYCSSVGDWVTPADPVYFIHLQ